MHQKPINSRTNQMIYVQHLHKQVHSMHFHYKSRFITKVRSDLLGYFINITLYVIGFLWNKWTLTAPFTEFIFFKINIFFFFLDSIMLSIICTKKLSKSERTLTWNLLYISCFSALFWSAGFENGEQIRH